MARVLLITADTTSLGYSRTRQVLVDASHDVVTSLDTVTALDAAWAGGGFHVIAAVRATFGNYGSWLAARWAEGVPILLGGTEAGTTDNATGHTAVDVGVLASAETQNNSSAQATYARNMRIGANHSVTSGYTAGSLYAVQTNDNWVVFTNSTIAAYGVELGDMYAGSVDRGLLMTAVEVADPINASASLAPGATAPARAVFCGWMYANQSDYTATGKQLLHQAVEWLANSEAAALIEFAGAGALAVDGFVGHYTATAVATGSGDLTAQALEHHAIDQADFTGSGLFVASLAERVIVDQADFTGAGDLAATGAPGGIPQTGTAAFDGSGQLTASGYGIHPPEMVLEILDPTLKRAPTALTVVIAEAFPNREIDFYIDNILVWTGETDTDGFMSPTSINVPEHAIMGAAGDHTLRASQTHAQSATGVFSLALNPQPYPIAMGPDAQAVDVPDAERPNGTRAWVLQDLHPAEYGGIGSYVMPYNPTKMSSPYLERQHATFVTTAGRDGQYHIMQGGTVPKQWTFEGYCPSKTMQNQLLAYRNLNRRFYIIDHRKRAWKVHFVNIEFTARKRQQFAKAGQPASTTDWGHDYVATLTVLDQTWVNPA